MVKSSWGHWGGGSLEQRLRSLKISYFRPVALFWKTTFSKTKHVGSLSVLPKSTNFHDGQSFFTKSGMVAEIETPALS